MYLLLQLVKAFFANKNKAAIVMDVLLVMFNLTKV